MSSDLKNVLHALFDAERKMLEHERVLLDAEQDSLEALFVDTVQLSLQLEDSDERRMRLCRLADLCAQIAGPILCDQLIKMINDHDAQIRAAAGEALRDVGYERYADVARSIDRAVDDDRLSTALQELPWVLAEIGEPSALGIIGRFLKSSDGNVVANAIEALVQLDEAAAIDQLQTLIDDERIVVHETADEDAHVTLGELAEEAIELLGDED
ncbi:MAG: HEAT repeat domain-containing protein [Polyangiales bacterium]